jgi:hypothetical protein
MPQSQSIDVLVLVKAAPVMTSELDETMCVAGIRVDGDHHEWVRLHPVPFRDLADESKFAKYQTVTVSVIRHSRDRRPETRTPIHGSITPGGSVGTENRWAHRRPLVDSLGEDLMCELVDRNRSGSGPDTASLGIVRPAEPPTFVISKRDPDQVKKWQARADAALARPSLFDDPKSPKAAFEVVPWRFSYRYKCRADRCAGHDQTIVDWEAVALWRHVRHSENWQDLMTTKFERQLWVGRDSVLFVGNMEQYPWNFLVLGVFWPPVGDIQGVLGL